MIGSLIIDKPEGLTSHDVVARVRRAAGTRRVGHAGTLDPFATGVLVVCVGRATRLVQFLAGLDKQYIATVRLGFATDTQDLTGKQITPLLSTSHITALDIRRAMNDLAGSQLQLPPMFSAKKVGGERLYRAAREGREIMRESVPITVHSIDLIEVDEVSRGGGENDTRDFQMRVRCSSGTYVRTLGHDIGNKLEVGAHLVSLRRTGVGHFGIERALALDEVEARGRQGTLSNFVVSPSETLAHLPPLHLDRQRMSRILNGRQVRLSEDEASAIGAVNKSVRLCDGEGMLVAVGEYHEADQMVKPRVVIYEKA